MSLITSSIYSIIDNGSPSAPFSPSKRICQGGPLSPFLFVLMAEGLIRLIKSHVIFRSIKGLFLHFPPPITHQQFVDENMLFGHPSMQEATLFKTILDCFSLATGTSINKTKSQIFFFNTPLLTQHNIAHILGFSISSLPSKYLGAPLTDSSTKHASWKDLLDILETHLSLWTHHALNLASRRILVKFVLQSMPLYLFSMFATPKWVLKAIRNIQHNFLEAIRSRGNRCW